MNSMNFNFEKFRKTCNDFHKVMDLRAEADRKAFTAYMDENGIKHTNMGRSLPFVWLEGTAVFGVDDIYSNMTIYSFRDFFLPELSVDDILDFLEV